MVVAGIAARSGARRAAGAAWCRTYQTYRQLEVQKDDLRASHLLIFLMVTLLILLASSWVGLYLARRVTVPIQALAEGTRRISGGDLAHRVDVEADDELGVLVDSFNRMTAELERQQGAARAEQPRAGDRPTSGSPAERALIAAVLENVAAGVVSIDSEGRIFTCNDAALDDAAPARGRRWSAGRSRRPGATPSGRKLAALLREERRPAPAGRTRRRSTCSWAASGRRFEVKVTALHGAGGEPCRAGCWCSRT